MNQTIILAPGANNSELLRTLARFGKNTLGLRVFSRTELAKHALMRAGISITEEFLTAREEPSVIYSFLNEIGYFGAASFADAESLAAALATMRSLIPRDEEAVLHGRLAEGEFPEKNEAVLAVYDRFLAKCREDGRIDSISLTRRAIREAGALTGVDFVVLREFPLRPVDQALLETVSAGNYREITLTELCGREPAELSGLTFTEGYGEINEVKNILDGIYREAVPLDRCVVAAADTSAYAQVLYDLACSYGIPVTYGSGVPILNANPARLLKLIFEWKTGGYHGIDALSRILGSEAFDRREFARTLGLPDENLSRRDAEELAAMAGNLRLSFDGPENRKRLAELKKSLDKESAEAEATGNEKAVRTAGYRQKVYGWTAVLAEELALGCSAFLSKYAVIREDGTDETAATAGTIDRSALNVITEALDAYARHTPDGDVDEIIPDILRKTVCSESSRAGHLHVTSIKGALSCIRENLYVCGLDSSVFPGSPAENYLLLDSDLLLLASEETAPTSENRVREKARTLFELLDLAAALGVRTRLSYSGYSLSEMKDRNPSSVLFSVYERLHPGADLDDFRNDLIQAPFFESAVSADRLIGKAYSKGAVFGHEDCAPDKRDALPALQKAWSPSSLDNYMQCPRHFYLANVLGIREEEPDDPFEVLSAAAVGTLAHTMMEKLAAEDYARGDFLRIASELFDDELKKRPPVHPSDAAALKKDFLKMMKTAYDMDPHNPVVSAEEEFCFEHPSGIRIHGYPDRVEQDGAGGHLIADFKTKQRVDHVQDDFDTCMQVVIYAWLCEQAGMDISSCEYRYLRKGRTVTCKYDDDMKDQLDSFLTQFRESIENNDFPRNESKDTCKYCKMAGICSWPEDDEQEGGV